jgi:hypothetical protein
MEQHYDFQTPSSLDEAHSRRLQLISDIQAISAQLGDRNKTSADGKRLTPEEFWAWRSRAVQALHHKEAALRKLKSWIFTQSKAPRGAAPAPEAEIVDDVPDFDCAERLEAAEEHLGAALGVYDDCVKENIVFRDAEKVIFEQIRVFLTPPDDENESD